MNLDLDIFKDYWLPYNEPLPNHFFVVLGLTYLYISYKIFVV